MQFVSSSPGSAFVQKGVDRGGSSSRAQCDEPLHVVDHRLREFPAARRGLVAPAYTCARPNDVGLLRSFAHRHASRRDVRSHPVAAVLPRISQPCQHLDDDGVSQTPCRTNWECDSTVPRTSRGTRATWCSLRKSHRSGGTRSASSSRANSLCVYGIAAVGKPGPDINGVDRPQSIA